MSIFCPDSRVDDAKTSDLLNILHTQEVLDKGLVQAHNFLNSNVELKYASIHSFSKEKDHYNDLILVLKEREVWRISADNENAPYGMKKT